MAGILDTAGDIGSVLAALEAARAKGRVDTAGINQNQGRAEADIYRTTMDAALKGPASSARDTALGDTLTNIKPFAWNGTSMVGNIPVPQGSGGLTPANFGPATRQAGADLSRVAGARVGSPAFNLPAQPKLAPLPTSSGLDSVLGSASSLASLAKAAGGSGGGGDLGQLAKDIAGLFGHGNFGTEAPNSNIPSYDPYATDTPATMPTDPSGGTGKGPGMDGYERPAPEDDPYQEFLKQQAAQGAGDDWTDW